jgi:hypothetical protein
MTTPNHSPSLQRQNIHDHYPRRLYDRYIKDYWGDYANVTKEIGPLLSTHTIYTSNFAIGGHSVSIHKTSLFSFTINAVDPGHKKIHCLQIRVH